MARFKVGDVVVSKWASVRNPIRKTIYVGNGWFVYYYDGKFQRCTHVNPYRDTEHYIVVGHEPIVELFKEMMDKYPLMEE